MTDRVLFVDDDRKILQAVKRIFYQEDLEVVTAESANEALSILETSVTAVVVTDERMPGMSGSELLMEVRERYPNTVRIMLTGCATLELALDAINRAEVHRFLLKPYSFVELRTIIHQALEKKAALRETQRMLSSFKQQAALLNRIEKEYPEIVQRLSNGEIQAERIRFQTGSVKLGSRRSDGEGSRGE